MGAKIKKIEDNLTAKEIGITKGYNNWHRVIDNELRIFINEKNTNSKNAADNIIDWKHNKAYLQVNDLDGAEEFYENNKDYKVRFFIKPDNVDLYSEYAVKGWGMDIVGLELFFQ